MIKDPRLILEHRRRAAAATAARFQDRPFRFGVNDCARMVAFHLRKLGHRFSMPLIGSYRSRAKALLLLRARGCETLSDALDGLGFERIAPASALVGDIIMLDAGDAFGALTIAMGNGRVLGYHEAAEGAVMMQPRAPLRAWRVA